MSMFQTKKIQRKLSKLDLRPNVPPYRITYEELRHRCSVILKQFGATVDLDINPELDPEDVVISGSYDADKRRLPISIILHCSHHEGIDDWPQEKRKRFRFELSQVIHHELVHKQQGDSPGRYPEHAGWQSTGGDRCDYLSNKDEIGAYAHDIALEIVEYYPTEDRFEVARNMSQKPLLASYHLYEKAFSGSNWEKVHHTLCKKVTFWLKTL